MGPLEDLEPTIAPENQLPSSESDQETRSSPFPSGEKDSQEPEVPVRRRALRLLREVAETFLLTVLIFVVINTLTGRFRIEGPSMKPTLHEGQYLIINKIVYELNSPRRGDIIVFHHPSGSDRDLIKRIVGLPSERVEINQGQVYIDGSLLEEPYVTRSASYSAAYELGPGEYFVLGDNRPNSDDSHNWGTLERDLIVGKAWISYWPPEAWGGVAHYDHPENLAAPGVGSETGGD